MILRILTEPKGSPRGLSIGRNAFAGNQHMDREMNKQGAPAAHAAPPRGRGARIAAALVACAVGATLAATGGAACAQTPVPSGPQAAPAKPLPTHHKAKTKPRNGARALTVTPLPPGTVPGGTAPSGPVSPYARVSGEHAQAGEPPPGHPMVRHPAPVPAPAATPTN